MLSSSESASLSFDTAALGAGDAVLETDDVLLQPLIIKREKIIPMEILLMFFFILDFLKTQASVE